MAEKRSRAVFIFLTAVSYSVFVFIFLLFFVFGPCARLSWPSRQLKRKKGVKRSRARRVWDVFHVLLGRTFVSGFRTKKPKKNEKPK